ncbi:DNA primase small subunit isoform X2 [Oncorhynchus tshawytscha]|uniref:DNA primase small subunit isoform X2 n=1 Tax=Oncorhynchus tshawytscha TaxID=74940 RepID=UPI001C3E7EBF|nr:DNA primase small subunit isoform X2 [Oncorhynchus tshawytscha]
MMSEAVARTWITESLFVVPTSLLLYRCKVCLNVQQTNSGTVPFDVLLGVWDCCLVLQCCRHLPKVLDSDYALCILDRALRVGQDILGSKEAADKVPEDILFLCRFFLLHDTTTAKVHYFEKEIMWQYCYPRVDVNVSKGVNNHLLKSPFSVHPKTGRISVPIDLRELDRFDPCDVPTIRVLLSWYTHRSCYRFSL